MDCQKVRTLYPDECTVRYAGHSIRPTVSILSRSGPPSPSPPIGCVQVLVAGVAVQRDRRFPCGSRLRVCGVEAEGGGRNQRHRRR